MQLVWSSNALVNRKVLGTLTGLEEVAGPIKKYENRKGIHHTLRTM